MNLIKNTAGQGFGFSLLLSATHAAATGKTVTAYVTKDGGTQVVAEGSVTEQGNGQYWFAPSQEDTNAEYVSYLFTATDCIPVSEAFSPATIRGVWGIDSGEVLELLGETTMGHKIVDELKNLLHMSSFSAGNLISLASMRPGTDPVITCVEGDALDTVFMVMGIRADNDLLPDIRIGTWDKVNGFIPYAGELPDYPAWEWEEGVTEPLDDSVLLYICENVEPTVSRTTAVKLRFQWDFHGGQDFTVNIPVGTTCCFFDAQDGSAVFWHGGKIHNSQGGGAHNAAVSAIKAKTDLIPATPASAGEYTSALATVTAKTDLIPANPAQAGEYTTQIANVKTDTNTIISNVGSVTTTVNSIYNTSLPAIKAVVDKLLAVLVTSARTLSDNGVIRTITMAEGTWTYTYATKVRTWLGV